MPLSRPGRTVRLATVLVVGGLALAACGDSSTKGGASSSISPGTKATGTPVLVGLINDEQGAIAIPELTTGANAAIDYVNAHGGVNGHSLKLEHCATNGTPESALACANTMISKKVSSVVFGVVASADAIVKPLEEAGIGVFAVAGQGVTSGADPEVTYTSTSQALTFSGAFKFFKQIKSAKPFLVAPDLGPATKQLAEQALVPAAKASGLDLSYILYNAASPDFAAAVTAAKKKGSDALYVLGSEGDCTNFVKTAKQLGWDKILFGGTCTEYVKALGAQAADVYTLSFLVPAQAIATAPAAKKPEVQLYIDQMKASGASDKTNSSYAEIGFSDLMTLSKALTTVTGEVTAATAKPAIKAFTGDVFLGGAVNCATRPAPGGTCGHLFVGLKTNANGTQDVVGGDFIDAATP
ncbi:MAG: hypothetical protein JWO12_2780 [Frankiales bacterium]|nr:hypothetical protein [Frankiales bacterium]